MHLNHFTARKYQQELDLNGVGGNLYPVIDK
jgi:hypothetical protein